MRGTVLVVVLAVASLVLAVAWHEFAVGLQGYGPLPRDGELGLWTLAVGTEGQTLTVAEPTEPHPLAIPLPPGVPVLAFDTLTPGPLGRLVGLGPLVKLSGVGVGDEGDPGRPGQDATGVLVPLHGGTDGCWQILDLTGVLGRLVARPDRISLTLGADAGTGGRVIVRDGALALTPTAPPPAGP